LNRSIESQKQTSLFCTSGTRTSQRSRPIKRSTATTGRFTPLRVIDQRWRLEGGQKLVSTLTKEIEVDREDIAAYVAAWNMEPRGCSDSVMCARDLDWNHACVGELKYKR